MNIANVIYGILDRRGMDGGERRICQTTGKQLSCTTGLSIEKHALQKQYRIPACRRLVLPTPKTHDAYLNGPIWKDKRDGMLDNSKGE
jgi:hypothetical protein